MSAIYGLPVGAITIRNLSTKKIKSFEVSFTCYDASGKAIDTVNGLSNSANISATSKNTFYWYVDGQTKSIGNVSIKSVTFTDGTTWTK